MLRYPESNVMLVKPSSVLHRYTEWGMGRERSLKKYMQMVGLNPATKVVHPNKWCHEGLWPPQALGYHVDKNNTTINNIQLSS